MGMIDYWAYKRITMHASMYPCMAKKPQTIIV